MSKQGCIVLGDGGAEAMIPKTVVHSDPEILGGTPVFVGTRVQFQSLFDYLEGGETLDEFLRQFPSVTREQAVVALDIACDSIISSARTAGRKLASRPSSRVGVSRGCPPYRPGLERQQEWAT